MKDTPSARSSIAGAAAALLLLLTAGCAGHQAQPETPAPVTAPLAATPVTAKPQTAATPTPAAPRAGATPATTPSPGRAATAAPKPVPPAPQTARQAAPPVTKAPPPAAASRAPAVPLDLASLKERLRGTKAIGIFSKITLKNQVDDLLGHFSDHYKGKPTPTMTELRRSYDLLMMKVLSLLQDDDQPLASAVVSSREAIWALLSDPVTFAALQT